MSFDKKVLRKIAASLIFLALLFAGQTQLFAQRKTAVVEKFALSKADDEFLDDLEKRSFTYFWEQTDANTGITLDRTRADGRRYEKPAPNYNVGSIAASGFALTSYCVAADRKWITPQEARTRTRRTLDFFANRAFEKNGWFYHWVDIKTGERRWNSEVSSIDTALLLGGVLTVRGCFADDKEIVRLATKIYNRVDFPWMLNSDEYLLSHGWRPETGFLPSRWDNYSEESILYILGIGSPTHPLPWQSWYAWQRDRREYFGYEYLAAVPPLFIHQYSQAWIDFRNKREHFENYNVNYFENSIAASKAQRAFCKSLSKDFPASYDGNMWGISASDSETGYIAWGGPPREPALDGTIVPYAPAGALMFTPDISLAALKEMKSKYGKVYGRYGFTDAFNPNDGWIDTDVIGIDLGITIIGIENLRTGSVWRWFMRNREINNGLHRAKIK